jgi:hypothetical protein
VHGAQASQQALIQDLQKQVQQAQQQLVSHRDRDESARNRHLTQQVSPLAAHFISLAHSISPQTPFDKARVFVCVV